jgi:hypothetical protein
MDPNTIVYRVQAWCPVPEGTEGAQFWGATVVEPGQVGSEFLAWEANSRYSPSRLQRKKPRSYPELGLSGEFPIYHYLQHINAIQWISDPRGFPVCEGFEP